MALGEIINKYRKEHDMSMDAFSEKSGISKAYISLLEKNSHPKTNAEIAPSIKTIHKAALGMDMDFDMLFNMIGGKVTLEDSEKIPAYPHSSVVNIPVYGYVSAGNGCFAEGNIESYIEIPETMAKHGEYFGLRIKGDSMEPDIKENDIVIVKKQDDIPEEGKTVVAIVNGDEGFCKRLAKYAQGLGLVSNNPNYMPKYFTAEEVRDLPVRIIGVVERLIRDF